MQIESEPNVLSSAKRKSSELHVEQEALKMEHTPANEKRLLEITKELADVEEKVRDLEAQFTTEKNVFDKIFPINILERNKIVVFKVWLGSIKTYKSIVVKNKKISSAIVPSDLP